MLSNNNVMRCMNTHCIYKHLPEKEDRLLLPAAAAPLSLLSLRGTIPETTELVPCSSPPPDIMAALGLTECEAYMDAPRIGCGFV